MVNAEWGETGEFMDAKCIASPKRAVKKKILETQGLSLSLAIYLVGGPK